MHDPARTAPRRRRGTSLVLAMLAALVLVLSAAPATSAVAGQAAQAAQTGQAGGPAPIRAAQTGAPDHGAPHHGPPRHGAPHHDPTRHDTPRADAPRADDESAATRTVLAAARDARGDHPAPRGHVTPCSEDGPVPPWRAAPRRATTGPVHPCEPRQNPDRGRAPPAASGT
ncbi:hypothetical protein [Streptomyces sp. NPDC093094]|uniref:hypothetical protein n=1 Tax=Streptomyces sp. NPDC093094 TaxID=3366026 RepID=UPI003824FE62